MVRTILIVSDRPICTEVLIDISTQRFSGAVTRVESVLAKVADQVGTMNPDLALVVINGAGPGAVAGLPGLVTRIAPSPVVILDDRFDRPRYELVLAAGARGYISMTSTRDLIDAAIGLVAAGGVHFQRPDDEAKADGLGASLSNRQVAVLRGVANGKTNREISEDLGITVATVKLHVHAILSAIGARNRTEAAILAREQGLSLEQPSLSQDAHGAAGENGIGFRRLDGPRRASSQ